MFAAIHLTNFALQALLRHSPELRLLPVALIPDKTPRAPIWQCTEAAREAGAAPGMTPSQGQARCPGLLIRLRSEEAERCARAALLETAGMFSPYVEDTAEGVCTLELKGLREFRPEEFARSLLSRLERLQLEARLGFAPNADLALLAAQSAPRPPGWRQVQDGRELHDLPLASLGVPEAMREILGSWGVRSVGAFVALGREPLTERLGPEALPLFDRASGGIDRPLRCLPPVESYEEGIEFEHPIETLEPLLFILRRLLEQIALRLESAYLVAADLTLRLGFPNDTEYVRTFKIPAPTAQLEVLFRALHTHLERFTADQPVISLRLQAEPCRPPRQQFGLFESALRDPNQFFETLARLIALLGNDRVGVPSPEDSHRPDAFRIREVDLSEERSAGCLPSAQQEAASTMGLCLRRFRPPLPADVELDPRRQPHAFTSAALRGRIVAAHGPMSLSGDWWDARGWSRAEWDAELADGALCRLYEENGNWFLEGMYD